MMPLLTNAVQVAAVVVAGTMVGSELASVPISHSASGLASRLITSSKQGSSD
jgi:hypothetical protein